MRTHLTSGRIPPKSGVPLALRNREVTCRICETTAPLTNLRPWPGARLYIGECRDCGNTISVQKRETDQ